MTTFDYKNKKNISIFLIKMLKSVDFFNQLDEFNDLIEKAKIDINMIIDKKRCTNFLEYAFSNSEKFFYLVKHHQANYHTLHANEEFGSTPSLKLLDSLKNLDLSFTIFDETYNEEKKIFESIKKDKETWLDMGYSYVTKEGQRKRNDKVFFHLYFHHFKIDPKELDMVLNFTFDEKEKQDTFNLLKNNLVNYLVDRAIFHYKRSSFNQISVNPGSNLKIALPTLIKHGLVLDKTDIIKEKILNMFEKQSHLGEQKKGSLDIISSLVKEKIISVAWLNEINFSQIYLNHLCKTLSDNLSYHKKARMEERSIDCFISHSPNVFEETLEALNELESLGVKTYIPASTKEQMIHFLDVMQKSRPNNYEQRNYQRYDLVRELITLRNETILDNQNNYKKIKI